MEWLPEELVEMIAEQLTARELASCCAVSVSWREMFGRDRLWRHRYDPGLAPYLETSKPVVQPGFFSPGTPDSTLSAISLSRLCWMRENRLQNNWNTGNFKVEELPKHFKERPFRGFYKQDYILACAEEEIEVWNIKRRPTKEFLFHFPLLPDPSEDYENSECFHGNFLIGTPYVTESNKIVVKENGRVGVYSFDLIKNEFQLAHWFVFDADKSYSNIPDEFVKASLGMCDIESCGVTGNVLVGTVRDDLHKLHVWDLDSGLKLKEVTCPFEILSDSELTITVPPSHETRNILLTYFYENNEVYTR